MAGDFSLEVGEAARKIESHLAKKGEESAWNLKLKFRFSSSLMYMAIGSLLSQDKIEIRPHKLTYALKKKTNK